MIEQNPSKLQSKIKIGFSHLVSFRSGTKFVFGMSEGYNVE